MREEPKITYCKLKYCTKCSYVWETHYCLSNRITKIYKYKELPSYKLDRQICAQCERERNGDTTTYKKAKRVETQYC